MIEILMTFFMLTQFDNISSYKRIDIVKYYDNEVMIGFKIETVYFLMTEKQFHRLNNSDNLIYITIYTKDIDNKKLLRVFETSTAKYDNGKYIFYYANLQKISIKCERKIYAQK